MGYDEEPRLPLLRSMNFWQYAPGFTALASLVLLARYNVWPFVGGQPVLGDDPSLWELLLADRVVIGFTRAGALAVLCYVIVSVPALAVRGAG